MISREGTMTKKTPLQKLISLTFDEDPSVRKDAAKELGASEDPAALFALVELTFDKDSTVKQEAQTILDARKNGGKNDIISISEIFGPRNEPNKTGVVEVTPTSKRRKILAPIEKLFERKLGKEKAYMVKQKMMPTLKRIYNKSVSQEGTEDSERKEALQEFLTTYLDVVSNMNDSTTEVVVHEEDAEDPMQEEELAEVSAGESMDEESATEVIKELEEVLDDEESLNTKFLKQVPDSLFKKAYEIMMFSGGNNKVMKQEMKRMLRNAERDIKLAFNLAKQKFREHNITNLTKLREKMRNVTTDVLTIDTAEKVEFKKKRSSTEAIRILVHDPDGNEGVIYLFEGRGEGLSQGMRIKIAKGYVKIIAGETALTLSSKGNIYIVL